ncbi:hypothetical protein GCM10022205_58800 [Spinactinospora alkalitolerans]
MYEAGLPRLPHGRFAHDENAGELCGRAGSVEQPVGSGGTQRQREEAADETMGDQ